MEYVDLKSENRSKFHFDDIAGGSEVRLRIIAEDGTIAPLDSDVLLRGGANGAGRRTI